MQVWSNSAGPDQPRPDAGRPDRIKSQGQARPCRDDVFGGKSERRPARIRSLGLIDTHRLSAECLALLVRNCDSSVIISQFDSALDCIEGDTRDFDAIVHNVHSALTSTDVALQEVQQLARLFPAAFLMTLSDSDDLRERDVVLRLQSAGSKCVISTQTTGLDDVLVALGLEDEGSAGPESATRFAPSSSHAPFAR